jgi:hypothetical protein
VERLSGCVASTSTLLAACGASLLLVSVSTGALAGGPCLWLVGGSCAVPSVLSTLAEQVLIPARLLVWCTWYV